MGSAGNGTMCDAFSTALFVMGEEQALDFWRNGGYDFDLVLVTEDGRVVTAAGLADRFRKMRNVGTPMKRFPELKPNFWDVIVVLAVIALAALSAMTGLGGAEPKPVL